MRPASSSRFLLRAMIAAIVPASVLLAPSGAHAAELAPTADTPGTASTWRDRPRLDAGVRPGFGFNHIATLMANVEAQYTVAGYMADAGQPGSFFVAAGPAPQYFKW